MATVICLINQKGGCGKSSTTFHLSGAFAQSGLQVLLVDIDPQGSLSQGFFGSAEVEQWNLHDTVASLFDDASFFTNHDGLIRSTPFPGISVCGANQHLASFNSPVPERTGMMQYALRDFLEAQTDFDIVLVDCPPNLYRCSWTAMVAADFVVIPVPPEDFGTQGLRAVHQAIDHARQLNPSLRRLGHLVTRYDRRLLVHRSYERRLRDVYAEMVLDTVIPEASAFKVALAARRPVEFSAARSRAANLTRQLSREILDRVAIKNAKRHVA